MGKRRGGGGGEGGEGRGRGRGRGGEGISSRTYNSANILVTTAGPVPTSKPIPCNLLTYKVDIETGRRHIYQGQEGGSTHACHSQVHHMRSGEE